ncbi:MAG: bifunctional oligoribonuclease/PAP phosphatase NrnA [Winogradskyella sp.]|uniref:DHH family phosphoesterase n=1 Tax=Winogradskyella sp. TaxID=1883156 RepID=UPI001850EDD9|nr:bifunctional oligoribonuclease/PAP phosphatase NrnA [Winogradskyella sp.]MBT8243754.1 bifunctional oligoribonuclease/PAP phosphatase NrnA [Winogradskyella sp.]NNK22053.1 bifunctional oligoribonuclease/PAP phosphatase NrnA [Winogradskyella sp.]
MKKEDISAVKTLLSVPKRIIIVPHRNPDGDAIGSTLGLMHYLKLNNHEARVIAPNDYPDFLKWIPGEDSILKFESQRTDSKKLIAEADIIFTLDFNALNRTGNDMAEVLEASIATKIMIDHHQAPDDYAKYMYSDVSMSSTCEMVFNFIEMLDDTDKITPDIATCIYVGIMTDTGSFRFRSTTSRTHHIIADLIDKGADNTEIHNQVYDTNSYHRLQLLGKALQNLKVLPELNTAYITLSQKELDEFNFKKGDTEGVVNYALSIENVVLAAIFIENIHEGIIKISLRSKGDFSVNEFSRAHFNGGGHTNAAGGRSEMSLKETVEKFIAILPEYKTLLS